MQTTKIDTPVGEDRRAAAKACPLLLAIVGGEHLTRRLFGSMLRRMAVPVVRQGLALTIAASIEFSHSAIPNEEINDRKRVIYYFKKHPEEVETAVQAHRASSLTLSKRMGTRNGVILDAPRVQEHCKNFRRKVLGQGACYRRRGDLIPLSVQTSPEPNRVGRATASQIASARSANGNAVFNTSTQTWQMPGFRAFEGSAGQQLTAPVGANN